MIPNIGLIQTHLNFFRELCLAVEVVVFETDTFLVIAKSGSPIGCDPAQFDEVEQAAGAKTLDPQRFEKISELVKGFRKTCQSVRLRRAVS